MPAQSTDYRVAVFGSGGVGKTSLVLRFVRGTFRDTYVPTIEDTYRQVISCNKQVCTLQITDTTGSHQFPAMQRLSITKAHAFILVYSVINKASFDHLQNIYNELAIIKMDELTRIPIMLVGNKSDEIDRREVSTAHGKALAQKWKCGFIETSAKNNTNIKEVMEELFKMETRRNMTLVGENKTVSKWSSFFRLSRLPSTKSSTSKSCGSLKIKSCDSYPGPSNVKGIAALGALFHSKSFNQRSLKETKGSNESTSS